MKGRKTLHPHIKEVKGTRRPDRENPNAPTPETSVPCAPDGLSVRAVEWFGRLTSRLEMMGVASKTHTEMLALLARRLAEIDTYDALIQEHGEIYISETLQGGRLLKANPAVTMRSEAMRHTQSLLAEFGLSLASVGKVSLPDKKPQSSAWGNFGK